MHQKKSSEYTVLTRVLFKHGCHAFDPFAAFLQMLSRIIGDILALNNVRVPLQMSPPAWISTRPPTVIALSCISPELAELLGMMNSVIGCDLIQI